MLDPNYTQNFQEWMAPLTMVPLPLKLIRANEIESEVCPGVATTVTIGSVAWPLLAKSGYGKEAAGGLLAAGGLGAIISPPVLGAAAFLIAEFLKISYMDVLLMAVVPTCIYYLSLFVMVELDTRKFALPPVLVPHALSAWQR